jgi:hypothetical protein
VVVEVQMEMGLIVYLILQHPMQGVLAVLMGVVLVAIQMVLTEVQVVV